VVDIINISDGDTAWGGKMRSNLTNLKDAAESVNAVARTTEYISEAPSMGGLVGTPLSVPTHDGSRQTAHPCVLFIPEGWNGYKYWMAHTPYPNSVDSFEDPNLAVSQDGVNWIAAPGVTQPLDDAPGSTNYNSDTDLVLLDNGTMYLFWRNYQSGATGVEEKIYYMSSTNGVSWGTKQLVMVNNQTTRRLLSPSFLFENGVWVMYAVDMVPSPNVVVRTENTSATPTGTWTTPAAVSVGTMQSGKEPWHIKIIKHNGRYSGLLNDTGLDQNGFNGDLLYITSADGRTFTNSGATVIPRANAGQHNKLYRASLLPATVGGVDGFRVWYSAALDNTWNLFRTFISETAVSAPYRQSAGAASITASNIPNATGVTVAITFPPGRFTSPPIVMGNADSSRLTVSANAITTTGCNLRVDNWSTGTAPVPVVVSWYAIQMTPTSATG
jgi:hypothetical protein